MGSRYIHNVETPLGGVLRGLSDDRLLVRKDGRATFLRAGEIDWIEARGNYLRVHRGPDVFFTRSTMNMMEARLDPVRFTRIHRSTIVNVERVKGLLPASGRWNVEMFDGSTLVLSRGYRSRKSMLARGLTRLSAGRRSSQAIG